MYPIQTSYLCIITRRSLSQAHPSIHNDLCAGNKVDYTSAKISHYFSLATLLERILQKEATVTYQDAMIKVVISSEVFQHRFGEALHRIQQAIDDQFPVRNLDAAVLVRDRGSRFEHVFKIWKTTER